MNVSELIAQLQDVYAEHGDLPVCTRNDEFSVYEQVSGASVEVFELDASERSWGDAKDYMKEGDLVVCL
jgi:hypothetical protein